MNKETMTLARKIIQTGAYKEEENNERNQCSSQ